MNIIKDKFFEDMADPYLKGNKAEVSGFNKPGTSVLGFPDFFLGSIYHYNSC